MANDEFKMYPTWEVELAKAMTPQMKVRLERAKDIAYRRCPKRTGHLASTIHGEMNVDGSAELHADADYASYIELGVPDRIKGEHFLAEGMEEAF